MCSQLDMGVPAMTMCCNKLDACYENCGTSKYVCDSEFRSCLHGICSDINKSLGFESSVQGGFRYSAGPLCLCPVLQIEMRKQLICALFCLPPLCISVFSLPACGSMADTLYNTVWTLGCRSYMNSQRAACICDEEERDEL